MAAPELASRRLLLWFAATTVPATLALVWLGWFVVRQDRLLAHDRQRTEREQTADVGVAALARTLAEFESALVLAESATKAEHSPPFLAHTPILVFDTKGVVARAGLLLPYSPAVSRPPVLLPESFARADNLEFVMGDPRGAVRAVLPFSRDGRPAIQAEAWLRLARNYRKMGDVDQALTAYRELSSFGDATAQGLPAGLMGHTGRALLLAGTKRTRELREEAAALSADLAAGRWRLTQSQFEYHTSLTVGWLGPDAAGAVPRPGEAHAHLLAAAAAAWREGLDTRAEDARPRRVIRVNGASILVLRRPVSQGTAVMLVGAQVLGDAWQGNLPSTTHAVDFALSDPAGEPFLGSLGTDPSRRATRNLMTSGLSWVLTADSREAVSPVSLSASARLMLGGVTLMLLVAVLSGYAIIRALSREMRVARLQTAFVAAVSHEFRTPLTTIRQFSEMLARSRVSSDERRQEFYEAILGESERLRRLVESLLDFGRMEAGQMAHKAESVDLDSLVDDISSSVRRDAASTGHDIDVDHEGGTPSVVGDRDALGCAIRNLLDNAVKYSPAHKTIDVSVGTQKGRVSIRVRDRGVGIPVAEQHEIFNKFVRGASATASHIAGTGLGLAMARQIVEAHHGTLSVQSTPGEGSTFTINLPAQEGAMPQ